MQTEKLRQRFEHAESTIAELARTCASHRDVPDSLKQSIQQLDDQARQCHSRLEGAEDHQTFVERRWPARTPPARWTILWNLP
jgi:chromosome segregation ATPase